jgi:nicotinamide mononucleotide transporter
LTWQGVGTKNEKLEYTFLMVWRYKEQWLVYIILNLFTILMWSIRAVNGSPDGAMMIVMWSAYLVNAVYGYYNWSKGVGQNQEVSGA